MPIRDFEYQEASSIALHCSGGAAVTNAVCIFAAVRQCNNDDLLHPHDTISYGRKCTMMAVALFQKQQSLVSWFPPVRSLWATAKERIQFKRLQAVDSNFFVGFKPANQISPHILA